MWFISFGLHPQPPGSLSSSLQARLGRSGRAGGEIWGDSWGDTLVKEVVPAEVPDGG